MTVVLLLAGCGVTDDDPEVASEPDENACPAEGCRIDIVDVVPDSDELRLTWEANFLPDIDGNHIHVYWDIYTADQVSDDAEDRGFEMGDWDPVDDYPAYVTSMAASVANRGDSTTICVTAGDVRHSVIDSSLVDCRDVSDVLEG